MNSMETFKAFLEGLDQGTATREISLFLIEEAQLKNDYQIFRDLLTPWILNYGHFPGFNWFLGKVLRMLNFELLIATTILECLNGIGVENEQNK